MTKYRINQTYFENIDTQEKAYWLGFLYADGYIKITPSGGCTCVRLKLAIKDISHLEKFKHSLESTHPIEIYETKNPYCQISIGSKKMVNDLINQGCTKNKGYKIRFPNIKEELKSHFIRGYFDGDGSVCYRGGNRYRFTMTSNNHFIMDIIKYLGYGNISRDSVNEKLSNFYIDTNSNNFGKFIYNNSMIHLERKYQIYLKSFIIKENKKWLPNKYIIINIGLNSSLITSNLAEFCKNNNLLVSSMYKVLKKKYNTHKGYYCEYL